MRSIRAATHALYVIATLCALATPAAAQDWPAKNITVIVPLGAGSATDVMTRVGQGATLSAEAYDRGQTVKLATGTLATVDNVIDPTTGTVKLRAMFDNADGKLFPSQFVNIRLLVDTERGRTVVPASAIERGAQGAFVYVVTTEKDTATVAMRSVTLGAQDGDRVAILKGLNPGETVVTDGADRLSDGAEVTLPKDTKVDASHAPPEAAAHAAQFGAARAALEKACAADLAKSCAGEEGRARFQCLRQHQDDLSAGCSAALAKMPHRRRQ